MRKHYLLINDEGDKMRDIKFRVWRKDTKKIYPPFTLRTYWNVKKFPTNEETEFKNVVFMQFTGFEDKYDKEIYEGDILKTKIKDVYNWPDNNDTVNCLVEFRDGAFCLCIKNKEDGYYPIRHDKFYPRCCKLIGNIYENPDLLERQKQ